MAVLKDIARINRMHKRQIHLFRIIMVFNLFPPFQTHFIYVYIETYVYVSELESLVASLAEKFSKKETNLNTPTLRIKYLQSSLRKIKLCSIIELRGLFCSFSH